MVRATGADGVVEPSRAPSRSRSTARSCPPAGSRPLVRRRGHQTGGAMLVDGTLVDSGDGPGSSIEFRQRSDPATCPRRLRDGLRSPTVGDVQHRLRRRRRRRQGLCTDVRWHHTNRLRGSGGSATDPAHLPDRLDYDRLRLLRRRCVCRHPPDPVDRTDACTGWGDFESGRRGVSIDSMVLTRTSRPARSSRVPSTVAIRG